MKLRNLNNASTLVEAANIKLLLDPWLIGNLYNNAWSPADSYVKLNPETISDITHIFISHIHQDHWDIDTLKVINKESKVLIPDYGFNNVIKNTVSSLGFSDIQMVKPCQWLKITADVSFYIIPPLNSMAQNIAWYVEKSSETPIAIDTGIIIQDNASKTTHLILGDNTPYDINSLAEHLPNNKIDSFWFPYNGFAQDYPLCYNNLSLDEKKEISLEMTIKRERSILKAIELIKPKYLIPHSSDFILNGDKKDEFLLVHSDKHLDKKKYAKHIEQTSNIPAYALFATDHIEFRNNNVDIFIRDNNAAPSNKPTSEIIIPVAKCLNQPILPLLKIALENMVQRCSRFNVPIDKFSDWQLKLMLDDQEYVIDFEEKCVSTISTNGLNSPDKKTLTLHTSLNVMHCILDKSLHINNCQIGCYLNWEREPNEFNKWLYDALNFLHI